MMVLLETIPLYLQHTIWYIGIAIVIGVYVYSEGVKE